MTSFSGFEEFADDLREFAEEASEAAAKTPEAVDEGVATTARHGSAQAAYYAPQDTGELARDIEAYRRGLMSWGWGTDLEHGPPQEYGSGLHGPEGEKYPIEGDPLVFEGEDGQTVVTDKVMHPGVEPSPFVRPSFNDVRSELEENINAELDRVYEQVFS
ncbi:hypothetical protein [Halococcus saccharolyticus]|uniref:HK97 gp10 family phage protein n=1 Tax=Halococcus saccharolyticus DSM 5350 TaxID=1227455 RepID=M0MTE5_9EURY|nr:hypothetical protein [Halococcus saccharolyticus]EMA47999.1 hypothetical protein C449_00965 [Halococcus saccharolyticus DSM 5350]